MEAGDIPIKVKSKVAVIGAGPSGLVTSRHLRDIADVQVFESKDDVGGLWNYSDINEYNHPDLDKDVFFQLYGCTQGSIYKDLITNNPKQWMSFKDFSISKDWPNIMEQERIQTYLRDYAEHFGLYDLIKFNTTVKRVKIEENFDHKFKVTTVPTDMNCGIHETTSYYDYVIVWNGHQSVPYMPELEGKDEFKGKILHVHSLRKFDKEEYDNKNILIVGGSFSGWDIAEVLLLSQSNEINPRKVKLSVRSSYSNTTVHDLKNNFKEKNCNKNHINSNII